MMPTSILWPDGAEALSVGPDAVNDLELDKVAQELAVPRVKGVTAQLIARMGVTRPEELDMRRALIRACAGESERVRAAYEAAERFLNLPPAFAQQSPYVRLIGMIRKGRAFLSLTERLLKLCEAAPCALLDQAAQRIRAIAQQCGFDSLTAQMDAVYEKFRLGAREAVIALQFNQEGAPLFVGLLGLSDSTGELDESERLSGYEAVPPALEKALSDYIRREMQKDRPVLPAVLNPMLKRLKALPLDEFAPLRDELAFLCAAAAYQCREDGPHCLASFGDELSLDGCRDAVSGLELSADPIGRTAVLLGGGQLERQRCLRALGRALLINALGLPLPARGAVLPLPRGVYTHFPVEEGFRVDESRFTESVVRMQKLLKEMPEGSALITEEPLAGTGFAERQAFSAEVAACARAKDCALVYATANREIAHLLSAGYELENGRISRCHDVFKRELEEAERFGIRDGAALARIDAELLGEVGSV